jgi:lipoate-protein ligase A
MNQVEEKPLSGLASWVDPTARDGPEQMACDEILLSLADTPILRVFRWRRPWLSAGYFTPMDSVEIAGAGLPVCRRWTGGGIVTHSGDFTFSLCVPRSEKLATVRPAESYRRIHRALSEALRETGVETDLAISGPQSHRACFAGAVEHDLVSGGAKIAGGAQRRTRNGLLHQGSVQAGEPLGSGFGAILARTLAGSVEPWTPHPGFEERVRKLTGEKYASPDFLSGPSGPMNFTRPMMP